MTEYIQVDRDQLRVGMRFDYRSERETEDLQVTRTITSMHPIAYDYTTQFGNGKATLTDLDLAGRKFYVHPDDLHVDEPQEQVGDRDAAATRAAYDDGVRDGYLKAQQEQDTDERIAAWDELSKHPAFAEAYAEDAPLLDAIVARLNNLWADATRAQGAKPTGAPKHRDIRREDAVLWAVQALGGTPEAAHLLIPLAQQIERYVNGNDEQEAVKVEATDFPTVIETDEQAALDWPVGTEAGPDYEGSTWRMTTNGWRYLHGVTGKPVETDLPIKRYLRDGLNVTRLGAGA